MLESPKLESLPIIFNVKIFGVPLVPHPSGFIPSQAFVSTGAYRTFSELRS